MSYKEAKRSILVSFGAIILTIGSLAPLVQGAQNTLKPNLISEFLHNGFWAVIEVDSALVCAMEGGIGVLTLDTINDEPQTPGDPINFIIREFLPLGSRPISLRSDGSEIVARMQDDTYRFFSLTQSLKLQELGEVSYTNEIQDFLFKFGNLYFAEEFRGVTMYRIDGYSSMNLIDSSMLGVRVIQLSIFGDTLYALDDYNGVLRYSNPEIDLHSNAGYLYLPYQLQSFTPHGDHLNLAIGDEGFKSATFDSSGFLDSVFERQTVSFAAKVFETDSNFIILSTPNVIETQDKNDPGALNLISVHGNTLGSTLATFGEKQVFVTPSRSVGLAGWWMNVSDYPKNFANFDHPGPIGALYLRDGYLYTAGNGNAFEKYNPLGVSGPELLGSRSFPTGTAFATSIGSTVYMLDNASVVPLIWVVQLKQDALPIALGSFGVPLGVDFISIHSDPQHFGFLFILRSGNKFYVNRTPAGQLFGSRTALMNLGIGPIAVTFARERLYHYSSKGSNLTVSKLTENLEVEKIASKQVQGPVNAMLAMNNETVLLAFTPGLINVYNIQTLTDIELKKQSFVRGNYTSAIEKDGMIFAVGPNSTGVLSFENNELVEIYFEASSAKLVTAEAGMFATSNGTSIKLFDLIQTDVGDEPIELRPADFRLLGNYPNPFNGETLIQFSGSPPKDGQARIVVYNVLGRRVRELRVNGGYDGAVRWDGRDESGSSVASGMYFARLILSKSEGRRAIKMIYLK